MLKKVRVTKKVTGVERRGKKKLEKFENACVCVVFSGRGVKGGKGVIEEE